MQVRSLEWAKNGTYKGFARELLGNYERGIEIIVNDYPKSSDSAPKGQKLIA
jgi:hypothetical protein